MVTTTYTIPGLLGMAIILLIDAGRRIPDTLICLKVMTDSGELLDTYSTTGFLILDAVSDGDDSRFRRISVGHCSGNYVEEFFRTATKATALLV